MIFCKGKLICVHDHDIIGARLYPVFNLILRDLLLLRRGVLFWLGRGSSNVT